MKQTRLPEWLTAVSTPVTTENPCGEDPRYLDSFLLIKEEIEKLSGTDYERVINDSRELLCSTTKDLRIAAFLLLASTFVDGWPGLYHGLCCYRILSEEFWDQCHPQKENQRQAALMLLNNPRLTAFAENSHAVEDHELTEAISQEIVRINAFLVEKLGGDVPRLSGLAQWFGKKTKEATPKPAHEENRSQATAVPTTAHAPVSGENSAAPGSEREFENEARKLHKYLSEKGDDYRAIALSRALFWSTNSVPPNEQGHTKVPAPRASGWAELNNLTSAGNKLETIRFCEKLFMETGYRYAMKLQYILWQQAKTGKLEQLQRLIEAQVCQWSSAVPEILQLYFADASPFCDGETLMWIETLVQQSAPAGSESPSEYDFTASLEEAMDAATTLAGEKQLAKAIAHLRQVNCQSELERLQKQLCEARLCLVAGKPQMAESVLRQLHSQAQGKKLGVWHPQLAIEIIQLRCKALQSLNTSDKLEKTQIAQEIQQLHSDACLIDLSLAANLT